MTESDIIKLFGMPDKIYTAEELQKEDSHYWKCSICGNELQGKYKFIDLPVPCEVCNGICFEVDD